MNGNTKKNIIVKVCSGNDVVQSFDLNRFNKPQVTFGSNPENDIVIDSPVISDYHGYFQFTNIGWVVFNGQSRNGLIINDVPRKDARIEDGMNIRIVDIQNTLIEGVSLCIEIKSEIGSVAVSGAVTEGETAQNQPKKKSKAPVIVAIVLACVFGFVGLVALAIGLGGYALYKYYEPKEATKVDVSDVYEYDADDEYYDYDDTYYDDEETTESVGFMPEKVPTYKYCEQFLLAECDGTDAVITLYEKDGNGWVERMSVDAKIGKNGLTYDKHEGDGCTPAGEFALTFYCGMYDTKSNLDFRFIYDDTVWVDDEDSYYYNTIQSSEDYYKDWDSAEPMYDSYFKNSRHNFCINIDANGDGLTPGDAVPGKGSVITLCGKNATLTATHGCIDISDADMNELLGYLDSGKNPEIIIY